MDCVDGAASDCIVVEGAGRTVMLMGDSNAHMMLPGFIDLEGHLTGTYARRIAPLVDRALRASGVDLR